MSKTKKPRSLSSANNLRSRVTKTRFSILSSIKFIRPLIETLRVAVRDLENEQFVEFIIDKSRKETIDGTRKSTLKANLAILANQPNAGLPSTLDEIVLDADVLKSINEELEGVLPALKDLLINESTKLTGVYRKLVNELKYIKETVKPNGFIDKANVRRLENSTRDVLLEVGDSGVESVMEIIQTLVEEKIAFIEANPKTELTNVIGETVND